MGGLDKGLVTLDGNPMVSYVCERLGRQCNRLVINANRNHSTYEALGYPVIQDELVDYQGPLAGMLAGLASLETEWMITCPTDGPFVASDYVARMLEGVTEQKAQAALAYAENRLQPVYALLHHSLKESLESYLETQQRKIDSYFATLKCVHVDFSSCTQMFFNVNSADDLKRAEAMLGQ